MLDNLYTDIGGKIKNLAKGIFIAVAIGAIITGWVFLFDWGIEDGWWAIFIIIFGPAVAWVFSWLFFAFGELVQDVQAIRNEHHIINDIKNNVRIIADPVIREAEEKARREAEEKARREAEEKARREAEEKARREAEEKARREAEEKARREAEAIAKPEAEKRAKQTTQKKEKTLSEELEYALMFQTDDGMVRHLKGLQDAAVQDILKSPQHLIREQIKNLLEHM